MTSSLCDYLASMIRDGASVQSGIAETIGSSLFNKAERGRVTIPPYTWLQQDIDSDIYVCHGGFDSRYENPHGKGGRYATLEDVRNLFSIGIEHGRAKALGSKPHYDADFSLAIGGYPKGSIVYTDEGIRMVSRRGQNYQAPQSDGTTDRFWARVDPTATFYPGWDVSSGVRLESGVVLPTEPTTTNVLAAVITADKGHTSPGRIVVFTHSATYYVNHAGRTSYEFVDLCGQGRMSVRLSLFDDIYTNPSHADEYIEVLSAEANAVPITSEVSAPITIRSPHMAVPLHPDKTYYVFVGYENGCARSNVKEDNDHHITGGFLNTYALDRGLDWTKV